jgi:hypothetical protein
LGRAKREGRPSSQPAAKCKDSEAQAAACSGAVRSCVGWGGKLGKGLEGRVGAKHQVSFLARFATSDRCDAPQTQQRSIKLGSGYHTDELGLFEQRASRRKIKLAEPTEPGNTLIERSITDSA